MSEPTANRGPVAWALGALHRMNQRHPWSHNDAFHGWIAANLPARRGTALDVGCGQGALLAVLAAHFDHVHGTDTDATMRHESQARCSSLRNVTVDSLELADVPAGMDLVTMVASLHHLDVEPALREVRRILNPNGRFLCVGLARSSSPADYAWDAASLVTNPVIGLIRHPRPVRHPPRKDPFPVKDPSLTFDEIRHAVLSVMPGARMRHRLAFRHTIAWTKPAT